MPVIRDKEFGDITVRRSPKSRQMKVSVAPNGTIRVSTPTLTPIFVVKRMIASSRSQIRKLKDHHPSLKLSDGMMIGKSHSLHVVYGQTLSAKRQGQRVVLQLSDDDSLEDSEVVDLVRAQIIAALRKEAKHYLPKRLEYLANQNGFTYSQVRFSHAGGRWGSCNQNKVISLNIALMNLPFELIDYVIIHELSHTIHLDHSSKFWQLVEYADPDYALHRKQVKSYSPSV